jgi:hypothetical protein
MVQERRKLCQEGAEESFKTLQDAPRGLQEASKSSNVSKHRGKPMVFQRFQRRAKSLARGLQDVPRRFKRPPRRPQDGSKTLQDAQGSLKRLNRQNIRKTNGFQRFSVSAQLSLPNALLRITAICFCCYTALRAITLK